VEPPPAASASGRAESGSTSRSPSHTPDAPQPLHFLFQLCHQAEQIIHLLAPNTAVVSAVLRYERQAQALPAARDLDTGILAWGLRLGPHTPSSKSFTMGGNHG